MISKDSKLQFLSFDESLASDFFMINEEWISDMFHMEEIDKQVLKNPKKYIIDKGGYIWFAKHSELGVLGTCALKKHEGQSFELTKMGVLKKARGLKVGEQLLIYVLKECQSLPIESLFLISNWDCQAAIHLYEKNGFVHDQELLDKFQNEYERTNVAMRYLHI